MVDLPQPTLFDDPAAERADPPDQPARDRIAERLDATLFVEAGRVGKTSALVRRVLALVSDDDVPLASVAAITFTEKAAAELRSRLREAFEQASASASDPVVVDRCRAALAQLDGAAIGTLHAFAQRILTEHPVEAGLPPRIEVLDEVASGVAFERRWAAFLDDLLEDVTHERALVLLLVSGVKVSALHSLGQAFSRNWDLVADRVPEVGPVVPHVRALVDDALGAVDDAVALRERCSKGDDKLVVRLDAIAEWAARLRSVDDEEALLAAIAPDAVPKPPSFNVGGIGSKDNWGGDCSEVRDLVRVARAPLDAVRQQVATACAEQLGSVLRAFTLGSADQRRAEGRLEFHDLLVLARAVLRDPEHGASVRTRLHERYARLLLDEFQDTDPIQVEIAVRIAAADPGSTSAGAADWRQVPVTPGRLFFVGDPKQSIYRFRRADISLFLDAAQIFGRDGGAVALTTNFRTVRPVIDWVNTTFGTLMRDGGDAAEGVASQPRYIALHHEREPAPADPGPPVSVLGREPHPRGTRAAALRAAEAADVVAAVRRVLAEGWLVCDRRTETWRRAEPGDITILVPARTSLPFLEDELDAGGVPYRAEASSLVYATRAVRDLLMVVRAIDSPRDALAVVSALRTPLLGCGDDDLFRHRHLHHGWWDHTRPQPESVPVDDVVGRGLAWLAAMHERRTWLSPSELLAEVVEQRRAMELGFAEGRPRDVWRRLRFVVDQARAWSEATGGNVRDYLAWVAQQSSEGARVSEAVLPETDDHAVRIMTIHAAKGLEFPIVVMSGMTTEHQVRYAQGDVRFPPDGRVAYTMGAQVRTPEFEAFRPIDEIMAADERVRLLYVAATRARDHLVLSLHRTDRPRTVRETSSEVLVAGMGALVDELPDGVGPAPPPAPVAGTPASAPQPFEEWDAERTAALAAARVPRAVAATALTDEGRPDVEPVGAAPADPELVGEPGDDDPGSAKRPTDLDLPPWLKGRYGTAVGRAVHGVLQSIDLATGDGLDALVAAQCQAEAVPDRAATVRALVEHALASATVRAAAQAEHWRELYACAPVGSRLLEGYIDLLYRTPDGLVVVDHKTAATADPAELDRRVLGYRSQGASYALTVAATTGEPVVRVVFLFLTPEGAVERELPDLATAVDDARAAVLAGTEVVTA